MNQKQFIDFILPALEEYGVKLALEDAPFVDGQYGGFFDPEGKRIAVGMRHKQHFGILVHEYSHFEQWIKKPAFWDKVKDGHSHFFQWLETNNPVNRSVIKWKEDALTLELDCEERAMKLIDSLNLEIDKKIYAQKANAYLLSYHLVATYRKWPKGSSYGDKISSLMPAKLLTLKKLKNTNSIKGEALNLMVKEFLKV